ncbi:septal ring lytic transglycosylase RlpA family protein [Thiocystis violascens]|uniref:Endolytic peptidoglycan transglycosylase RlpA n=1 Tax=Thiocystis violascens (strain ATCC 17096 / DSM 198 / 6111) TaxID=765911 RepID=I3YFA6_THIV6|nr:septal ring lytic transglycosylase RlpA family protein [Thiocystis violascens]AFL75674.1 rare lipoprotein A [Thiocystis violascens DSM 198]
MRTNKLVSTTRVTDSRRAASAGATVVWLGILLLLALLSGCASQVEQTDDDDIPPHIARIPDAVPRVEPLSKSGNPESYVVFGKRYRTQRSSRGYVERGLASWYGKPFHGRKTSSGETYDMHAMSAAHKTLPLPTYARVTNVENGRSIVIRINDRGPFHGPRLIDLSHTAAVKLGVVKTGTAMVEVRAIDPKRPQSDPGPFLVSSGKANTRTAARAVARADPPARPARASTRMAGGNSTSPPVPAFGDAPRPVATVASRAQPASPDATLYLQIGAFGDPRNAERLRERLKGQLGSDSIRILTPETGGAALYKVRVGPLASARDADRLTRQLVALGVDRPQRVTN